jgi:uncharacterized protein
MMPMVEAGPTPLAEKEARLREFIAGQGSLLVSFSGGVDSALLALISREVLGERAGCAFLSSPLTSRREEREARALSAQYGLSCLTIPFPILRQRRFRMNPAERCYHCKKYAATLLKALAREKGFRHVADGLNLSDYREYRPGIRGSAEEGVLHPFVEAGMTKEDIRALAHARGLDFWNRPSSACLASRIPYGEAITRERLRIVAEAEDLVQSWEVDRVRVRLQGDIARVEVEEKDMHLVLTRRIPLVKMLKSQGVCYVTLDLEGYRSGSMDEVLPGRVSRMHLDRP